MTRANKNKKHLVVIAALLVIAIAVFVLTSCNEESSVKTFNLDKDANTEKGAISTPDPQKVKEDLNKIVEDGMMTISMNLSPVFQDGTSQGNLLIYNDPSNKNPQVVEIYLKDSGELIYQSGGIDVGEKIEFAPLLVDLETGSYPCVAYFNAVNAETKELVGKAGAEITIEVLN